VEFGSINEILLTESQEQAKLLMKLGFTREMHGIIANAYYRIDIYLTDGLLYGSGRSHCGRGRNVGIFCLVWSIK
jgi:hypothetical protein